MALRAHSRPCRLLQQTPRPTRVVPFQPACVTAGRQQRIITCRAEEGEGKNDSASRTEDLLGELLGEPKQEQQQEQQQQQQQKPEPPSEAVAEVYRAAAAAAAASPPAAAAAAAAEEPASGRPNPAIAGADANLQVSKEVIEKLRSSVFGFDTMWVTSVENYEQDGVVFKGNVRSKDPREAYAKLKQRLQEVMGDQWQIFLLQDKEEKPTAVLLPSSAREGVLSPVTEVWLAVAFGAFSVVSSLQAAGIPLFQWLTNPFYTPVSQQDIIEALPLAGAFWLTLLAHEAGHRVAANKAGAQLYLPLIIPAGFGCLGSFGGITRFKGFVPNRETLLDVAVAGPLWGSAASGALLLLGLALSSAGLGDVSIDSPGLADSFLVALLGQAALGEALANPEVQVSSLLVAGWAGLVVNSLNLLPTGELDGGRIALACFGRRAAQAVGVLTVIGLAIFSFSNPLAFYWVVLVLALQRGPILPCQEELSEPAESNPNRNIARALYALPLLVLLPYPVEYLLALQQLPNPSPF
ncbi:hypothetical protein OEZ85_009213 [Tetradesmus obliquus]|uniref:Peptidase M50 domain-containing protein n=1 Tax=Tetradesmus obliquus TaxID=3088 RepID=A0ABY8U8A6_TETOB|nr:hypothetical protein OEZ85_009213 [Tetradesmus obliquus]